jgi:hypothetical protein
MSAESRYATPTFDRLKRPDVRFLTAPLRSTAPNVGPRHSSDREPKTTHLPASNSLRSGVVTRERQSATTFRKLHVWALFLADPFSKTSAVIFNAAPTPAPAAAGPPVSGPRRFLPSANHTLQRPGSLIYNSLLSSKTLRSLSCWLHPTPAPDSHHAKPLRHLSRQRWPCASTSLRGSDLKGRCVGVRVSPR